MSSSTASPLADINAGTAEREMKKSARTVADKVSTVAGDQIINATDSVASQAGTFGETIAKALRSGATELSSAGYARAANLAYQAGDAAQELTEKVTDVDGERIAERAKQVAAEKPVLVFGALAVAGFAGAMLLARAQSK